ncbi:DUF2513 domain-containing protein [Rhodoblastus acidophilus]|uniref:DUF2513 domain-containing protein n=1 Tax=Candidatus Rhodoblastus alkanivorans TaxID=2954117 RepID=A0ABS9ZBM6_9HYPH|nr:DUF2513 domain-containing protein [Candidatus Rhodoblastus alkanivorans]MCI4680617.1 DUF2513 domain-containing protein [Candidatus Rhodoblastus alkanivorans]MCI4684941.1 DUF2513 domain-containing protein [Candidatus Rhodoblastus alkanivorans]MDI4643156.1 DUF2513 domain-containing protein [Rhodoblastus acidophilus]
MKRDMDLVRELLLKLEALDIPPGVVRPLSPYNPAMAVNGFTGDEVGHHLRMLVSGNLVETAGSQSFGPDGSLVFRQISWAGHDFLDSVRDPEIWAKTKKGAAAAGGFTVDLLKDLAKGLVKKQIEEFTGVKL